MQQQTARYLVRSLAIIIWALTLIVTVLSLNALVQWQFFTAEGASLLSDTPILTAFVNMLLIISFGAAIGIGLWQRKKWARILAIVFASLVVVDVIVHLFWSTLDIGLLLLLIGSVLVIYLLGFRDDVKSLFK